MKKLFLNFTDPDGVDQEVEVTGEEFLIGRHSGCDLVIPDGRLSREHAKISRFGDTFVIADKNSSNGTTRNDSELAEPSGIERGDVFSFGGLKVTIRFDPDDAPPEKEEEEDDAESGSSATVGSAPDSSEGKGSSSGLTTALILAPIVGLFLILFIGIGAILILNASSDSNSNESARNNGRDRFEDPIRDTPSDSTPDGEPTVSDVQTPTPTVAPSPENTDGGVLTGQPTPIYSESTPGGTAPTIDKDAEKTIYSFMRRIATNDNRPYLSTPRVEKVIQRAGKFRGSSSLAANIADANSSKDAIKALASEKGIKPQFLATAAIAKLGSSRGSVVAKAREMADTLDQLSIVLSNELADDTLLVVAAYEQGAAGNTLAMRDKLASLTKKHSDASPREVRTIWFLNEKNEISGAQYDSALDFLAIGTITQNPKKFGISAPVLRLD